MGQRSLRHSFSLLNVDYVKLGKRWNYKNVVSPYYRLYYIDGGRGTISNSSTSLVLEPGNLYLIPSFTLCNLHCREFLSQYFVQFFEESPDGISLFANNRNLMKTEALKSDVQNFKRLLEINHGRGINRSDNPSVYEKDIYYKEYQALNDRQSLSAFFETQGILLQLISRFLDPSIFKHNGAQGIPSKIMDAISYIQLNLVQNLTVAHLAERANLDKDYFSRLFAKYTGTRPIAYIHGKRIERAQYLITTTNMANTEVALEVGFENIPYFSRVFKEITGITPGEYRNRSQMLNNG